MARFRFSLLGLTGATAMIALSCAALVGATNWVCNTHRSTQVWSTWRRHSWQYGLHRSFVRVSQALIALLLAFLGGIAGHFIRQRSLAADSTPATAP